jgi:HEAT repeats
MPPGNAASSLSENSMELESLCAMPFLAIVRRGAVFVLCPKCWNEMKATPTNCPNCGTAVDVHSRAYEHRLITALAHADPERRARICWVLGSRGDRSATPALVELLHDPDILVRVAALRGLGEIGDPSATTAVEKATTNKHVVVRTVAKDILRILIEAAPAESHHGTA